MKPEREDNTLIYLDYAASAPPYEEAMQDMLRTALSQFANPGAVHAAGAQARSILHAARRTLAECLNVRPQEIFFTSGGTEANNWAVKLGCRSGERRHIVSSSIEHKSVLESLRHMQTQGYEVTFVDPAPDGCVSPAAVEAALRPDTALVCVQAVNNETGAEQDVAAMAELAKSRGVRYLCDSVQSFGHVRQELHRADFISISAHKLGGPRGVGCLVVRYPNIIAPFIDGGGQEQGRRSGTENVPGIAGFAKAAQLSLQEQDAQNVRLRALAAQLLEGLGQVCPGMTLHAEQSPRHPGILNCRFPGITAEEMVVRLDLKGICVSPGAACAAQDPSPSHVLLAMGLQETAARESVRFSLGRLTTEQEIARTVQAVGEILRERWNG